MHAVYGGLRLLSLVFDAYVFYHAKDLRILGDEPGEGDDATPDDEAEERAGTTPVASTVAAIADAADGERLAPAQTNKEINSSPPPAYTPTTTQHHRRTDSQDVKAAR